MKVRRRAVIRPNQLCSSTMTDAISVESILSTSSLLARSQEGAGWPTDSRVHLATSVPALHCTESSPLQLATSVQLYCNELSAACLPSSAGQGAQLAEGRVRQDRGRAVAKVKESGRHLNTSAYSIRAGASVLERPWVSSRAPGGEAIGLCNAAEALRRVVARPRKPLH